MVVDGTRIRIALAQMFRAHSVIFAHLQWQLRKLECGFTCFEGPGVLPTKTRGLKPVITKASRSGIHDGQ